MLLHAASVALLPRYPSVPLEIFVDHVQELKESGGFPQEYRVRSEGINVDITCTSHECHVTDTAFGRHQFWSSYDSCQGNRKYTKEQIS